MSSWKRRPRPSAAPEEHVATWGPNASSGSSDGDGRRLLQVLDGWGVLHLDFRLSEPGTQVVADLPASAPTARSIIEVQTHDGGSVWINPGSRQARGRFPEPGQRYIVDLAGFWQ